MAFSIYSVLLPHVAYVAIALSTIYTPIGLYQAQTGGVPVRSQESQVTMPTPTVPIPSATPVPKVQSVISSQASKAVSSDGNLVPATSVLSDAQIQFLGNCESGMRPDANTGNGYYGAFQFSYSTWQAMGMGYERADLAPLEVQIVAVQKLLSRSSIWTQFPGCAYKMQSLGLI